MHSADGGSAPTRPKVLDHGWISSLEHKQLISLFPAYMSRFRFDFTGEVDCHGCLLAPWQWLSIFLEQYADNRRLLQLLVPGSFSVPIPQPLQIPMTVYILCFSCSWSSPEHDLSFNLQDYHSSRVLTLVYQPFALITLAILTYHEAKVNTRCRNLFGYTLFFISSLLIVVVSSVSCRHSKHFSPFAFHLRAWFW